jgi:hypothetical protein
MGTICIDRGVGTANDRIEHRATDAIERVAIERYEIERFEIER